ncbi:MAG: EAL domain-containing protein [Gammaproteobacteria bacterium]|nr:EAL domain-containing protein [Gammaproteobacteria bacterium]
MAPPTEQPISLQRPLLLTLAIPFLGLMVVFLGAVLFIDRQYNNELLSANMGAIEAAFNAELKSRAELLSRQLQLINQLACFRSNPDSGDPEGCGERLVTEFKGVFGTEEFRVFDQEFSDLSYPAASLGTDLSAYKNTIRWASLTYGIQLTKDGRLMLIAIRPRLQEDRVVGFVSAAVLLDEIMKQIAETHDASLLTYLDKDKIDRTTWEQQRATGKSPYPWNRMGGYLAQYSDTSWRLSAAPHELGLHESVNEDKTIRLSLNGEEYLVGHFPLFDLGGNVLGQVAAVIAVSAQVQRQWTLIQTFVPILLASGALLFLFFRNYHGRMELRVLESHGSLEQEITRSERMAISLRKLSSAVEQSGSGVVITDKAGRIEYVNPKFSEITGYQLEDIKSKTPSFLRSELTSRETHKQLWDTIMAGKSWVGDLRNRRKNGELYWSHLSIAPIVQPSGEITNFVATSEDITQMKDAQEEMKRLAYFDTLTNLPNRRLFRDRLQRTTTSLQRSGGQAALMFLDLDQFKRINDTLGHDAGDALLCEVAHRLKDIVREDDTIARLGGDEFTLLLQNIKGLGAARKVAQKILSSLHVPFVLAGREVGVTTSIGITLLPEDGMDTGVLMKNADLAMYEAKKRGRNNFQFFTKTMNDEVARRVLLEQELLNALRDDEFELFYQPLLTLDSGEITGVEALLRWRHPTRGLLAPGQFLSVAEESNIINDIGKWVLTQACKEVINLNRARNSQVSVSINLSTRQFGDPHLVDTIKHTLETTGMEGRLLHLEITESVLMDEQNDPVHTMVRLKQEGIYLSVDDFGTGYSSLSYLKRFPVDRLKVDRSFVRDIPQDVNDMEITAAIIVLAHKLNLEVVAEGVETDAQFHFLKQNQCDLLQGYLFGQPMPMQQLAGKLEQIGANFPRKDSVLHLPSPPEACIGKR